MCWLTMASADLKYELNHVYRIRTERAGQMAPNILKVMLSPNIIFASAYFDCILPTVSHCLKFVYKNNNEPVVQITSLALSQIYL